MVKITEKQFDKAEKYLRENCRPLEQARLSFLLRDGDINKYINALRKYQNPDGGFGKGLEPDFLLPDSSSLATSLAFQFLSEIPDIETSDLVKKAVRYLETTFNKSRNGWFALPKEVNNYPHAVWWNWDIKTRQTVIDQCWGNPSAELIGYLWKYRKHISTLDVDSLVEYAIQYWVTKSDFPSEHEVYSYIWLYKCLPSEKAKVLEEKLIEATKKLVTYDVEKWKTYTPQPIHFANSPDFFLYETVKKGIDSNLDYLINTVNENGVWSPNWTWRQYDSEWEKSKIKWQGILTIRNLKILRNYGGIE